MTTACDPELDLLAVRVESPLLARGELAVGARFPYAVGDWSEPCDWDSPTSHLSEVQVRGNRADIRRVHDDDVHHAALTWSAGAALKQLGPHEFVVHADGVGVLELTVGFSPAPVEQAPTVAAVLATAEVSWTEFWSTGGIVDLSGSTDPRAEELERRVVLSQYLTAVNCAGSTPPQETGLVTNSWRGRFHLEMHWWHSAHFALWGRPVLLERSLGWYDRACRPPRRPPGCRATPAPAGPSRSGRRRGRARATSGPAGVAAAAPDLLRRADLAAPAVPAYGRAVRPARVRVGGVHGVVRHLGSAAGTLRPRSAGGVGAGEAYPLRREARNPAFELAYWRWGLQTAQMWRERLGLARVPAWDAVAKHLGPLPERDGR